MAVRDRSCSTSMKPPCCANSRQGSASCWEAKCHRDHYSSGKLNNAQEFLSVGNRGKSHPLHCWKITRAHLLRE